MCFLIFNRKLNIELLKHVFVCAFMIQCWFRSERDKYLLEFARDDVQLLINELWKVWVSIICCFFSESEMYFSLIFRLELGIGMLANLNRGESRNFSPIPDVQTLKCWMWDINAGERLFSVIVLFICSHTCCHNMLNYSFSLDCCIIGITKKGTRGEPRWRNPLGVSL